MIALLCVLFVSVNSAQDSAAVQQVSPEEASQQTDDLLKEKLQVATQLRDAVESMHNAGQASFDELIAARLTHVETELQIATSREERVALANRRVEYLQQIEARAEQRLALGSVVAPEFLRAKLDRLDAQLAAQREMYP